MEIEMKFSVDEDVRIADIESIDLGDYRLSDRTRHEIDDTLLDTPDMRISGSGRSLRIRQDGDDSYVTFKGPGTSAGGLHQREEIELPTDPESAASRVLPQAIQAA